MFCNRRGVPVGASQKFANATAYKRARENLCEGQFLAPVRSDAQILVRCPVESRHLANEELQRSVGQGISATGIDRPRALEDSPEFSLFIPNGHALYL